MLDPNARIHNLRLGVDIDGTFTDVALDTDARPHTAKVLTTPQAPEREPRISTNAVRAGVS